MIYFQFLVGFLAYSGAAILVYSISKPNFYYFIGLSLALLANLSWLSIASQSSGKDLFFKALYWDTMFLLIYLCIPIFMFNVRLTLSQLLGVLLIVIGMIVTKV